MTSTARVEEHEKLLLALIHGLIRRDAPSYERALARFIDHDARFTDDERVREQLSTTLRRVAERVASQPERCGALLGAPPDQVGALADALANLQGGPLRSVDEFRTAGLMPELVAFLAQQLGIFQEDYLAFVDGLPELGSYSPGYLNFGPSGLCNLRCRDCILWGALFARPALHGGVAEDALLRHLADAEGNGVHGLSFCIGEPTVNMRLLQVLLERIRSSEQLHARSFVTNAAFARRLERARSVWERILEWLGPDKTAGCLFVVSLNDELVHQGVELATTLNALETFCAVMPNDNLVVQLIRDEGYEEVQRRFLVGLAERGLIDPKEFEGGQRGVRRRLDLKGGQALVFSIMAKMPPINSPGAEDEADPYVFYLEPAKLLSEPFPGLFMPPHAEVTADEELPESERLALGPDGQLYLDYHFMVRGVRPLGTTIPQALASFRRDPILRRLRAPGGLNRVFEAYYGIPPEQRPILDLIPRIGAYSTVSMAAANVIFGDEDLALRLARVLADEDRRESETEANEA